MNVYVTIVTLEIDVYLHGEESVIYEDDLILVEWIFIYQSILVP